MVFGCRIQPKLPREAIALRDEGNFKGLKLRLGRERISEDIAAIEAVRSAVGEDIHLMVDFNQGLHLAKPWSFVMRSTT